MSFGRSQPGVGAPEVYDAALAYAVPYSWGALYVTQEAEAAYGLAPIVPEVRDGLTSFADRSKTDLGRKVSDDPEVSILLCAQNELPVVHDPTGVYAHVLDTKGGLDIVTVSPMTRDTMEVSIGMEIAEMAAEAGGDPEHMVFFDRNDQQVPVDVMKQALTTHRLASHLNYAMADSAARYSHEYWRDQVGSRFLQRLRRVGGITLGGALLTGGGAVATGESGSGAVVLPLVITAIGAINAYTTASTHVGMAPQLEAVWRGAADRRKQILYADLHSTFCSEALAFPGSDE